MQSCELGVEVPYNLGAFSVEFLETYGCSLVIRCNSLLYASMRPETWPSIAF